MTSKQDVSRTRGCSIILSQGEENVISYWINMLFFSVPHPQITIVLGQILNWITEAQACTVQLTQRREPDSSFRSILIATHVLKLNSSSHCLPFLFLPWHLIGFLSLLVSILIDFKMLDARSINCKNSCNISFWH